MNTKGWGGYWQGLHYPTIEELLARPQPDPSWDSILCTTIRKNEFEEYTRLKGEIEYA
jgi:hypothetical protein